MSHELTETLVEPLTRIGLTVERAGFNLRVSTAPDRLLTVSASGDGLVVCHQLSGDTSDPQLWGRLNQLNLTSTFARYVARDSGVWVETFLPFGGRSLAANQLHVACGELDLAIQRYRSEVDRGAETVMQPQADKTLILPKGEETVMQPAAGGAETVALPQSNVLPASYMPGRGQATAAQTLTRRYGSRSDVPGRPEDDRARITAGGGGGAAVLVVFGLLLLIVLGGGGALAWLALQGDGEHVGDSDAPDVEQPPTTPTQPPVDDPIDPAPDDPSDEPPTDWTDPEADPSQTQLPQPEDLPEALPELFEWIRANPERALEGTRAAFGTPAFREDGNWPSLVEALAPRLRDRDVVTLLAARMRQAPPPVPDALRCLPLAHGSFRDGLIRFVVACSPAERDAVAAVLREQRGRDTADMAIEQGLVRIRRPAPDSLERLLERKGDDWLIFGAGRTLLEGLALDAVVELTPLQRSASPRVRATVAELCATSTDARAALKVLTPLLRDELTDVRGRAIESMVKLESPLASWPLARRLGDEREGNLESQLRTALRNLAAQQRTVELLSQLYGRKAKRDRRAALLGLEATGSTDAVSTIVKALNDADDALQLLALRQLTRIQKQPGLRPHVRKGTSRIREMARRHANPAVKDAATDLFVQLTGSSPR